MARQRSHWKLYTPNQQRLAPRPSATSASSLGNTSLDHAGRAHDETQHSQFNHGNLIYEPPKLANSDVTMAMDDWFTNPEMSPDYHDHSQPSRSENIHANTVSDDRKPDQSELMEEDSNAEDTSSQESIKVYWLSRETPAGKKTYKSIKEGLADGHDPVTTLHVWYASAFYGCYQTICKSIAKIWVKTIHPGKSVKCPYNNKTGLRPSWWPEGVIHKEPDHILMEPRVNLLMWMFVELYNTKTEKGEVINVDLLQKALEQEWDKISATDPKAPIAKKILEDVFHVRRQEEQYVLEEEYPGNAFVILPYYQKPLRGARGKRKSKNPAAKRQKRGHITNPLINSSDMIIDHPQSSGSNHNYQQHIGFSSSGLDYSSFQSPCSPVYLRNAANPYGPSDNPSSCVPTPPPSDYTTSPPGTAPHFTNTTGYWTQDYAVQNRPTYGQFSPLWNGNVEQTRQDGFLSGTPQPSTQYMMCNPRLNPSESCVFPAANVHIPGSDPPMDMHEPRPCCSPTDQSWPTQSSRYSVHLGPQTRPGMFAW